MKVILNDFVPSLGAPGDEVDVAPGYARNYLIPRKLGFEATEGNRRTYENNLKQRARKLARILSEAEAQKARLEKMDPLVFTRKAGEEGKLFGSVTNSDIEKELSERGFEIDRKKIDLVQPIKNIGEMDVTIKIHSQVSAAVKVIVQSEAAEEEPEAAPIAPAGEEAGEGQPAAESSETAADQESAAGEEQEEKA
ncbi:MAG: 50S ribosomal protein L9 [Candidatus Nitrospinota bacterium M3_3B_026]